MNKNLFTHKILPIVAIFMFVLFTLTTNCFATTDFVINDDNYGNLNIAFPDSVSNYQYYLCFYKYYENTNPQRIDLKFYFSDSPFSIRNINGGSAFNIISSAESIVYYIDAGSEPLSSSNSRYNVSTNTLTYDSLGEFAYNSQYDYHAVVYNSISDYSHLNNYEVLDADTGEIFFPGAPQKVVLAEIIQEAQPEKVTQEVVEIIPIVIPVLVGLIACLIGLRYLWRLLRKS